jgi:hypothetical protein
MERGGYGMGSRRAWQRQGELEAPAAPFYPDRDIPVLVGERHR